MKVWILVIKFLFIGALFIVSNYNLNLGNPDQMDTFQGLYYDWLNKIFNYGADITAYVAKSEWLPAYNPSLGK